MVRRWWPMVFGLLVTGCSLSALNNTMNSVNRLAYSFTPSVSMKQLDQWGNWVPCGGDGSTYDIRAGHQAAVRFYPGEEASIVSVDVQFDGNRGVVGCGGDYVIRLPDRRDHRHNLVITLILAPTGRTTNADPVQRIITINLDYHDS